MSKRRASGEGLLRWRKDRKHWEGRIVIGTNEKGNPISKCFSGKTQREVIEQMTRCREQLRGMTLSSDSRMIFRDWTEKWLNEYMVYRIRPTTIDGYRRKCELHIYPYLGDCQISKITTMQIQRMYNDLRENGRQQHIDKQGTGLTGSMVRSVHMLLHEIMEFALKENMILKNPTNGTSIPKIESIELQILDEKQLKIFIEAIQNDEKWRDFFYLEIMTGLRRGEICALKWSDFDVTERKLYVNRTLSSPGVVGKTKTQYSERSIKLPYMKVLKSFKDGACSEWLFPSPVDPTHPIDPETCGRRLSRILEHAGCRHIRFHDIRHTFATMALENGVDVKTLADILGHSTVETALDTYTHITNEMQNRSAVTIDRKIAGIRNEEENTDINVDRSFVPNIGARRKSGKGYIKQLSKNCWQGRYSPVVNGKRKTYNIYALTEEECEARLKEMIEEKRKQD